MTRQARFSTEFRAELSRANTHRKCDIDALMDVMARLQREAPLDARHKDHALRGRYPHRRGGYTDCRECHVCNDWLLVYRLPDAGSVHFVRTGTHSDLF